MDCSIKTGSPLFGLSRTDIIKITLPPVTVIKYLHVLQYIGTCFLSCAIKNSVVNLPCVKFLTPGRTKLRDEVSSNHFQGESMKDKINSSITPLEDNASIDDGNPAKGTD